MCCFKTCEKQSHALDLDILIIPLWKYLFYPSRQAKHTLHRLCQINNKSDIYIEKEKLHQIYFQFILKFNHEIFLYNQINKRSLVRVDNWLQIKTRNSES